MKQHKLKQFIINHCLTGWELEWTDLTPSEIDHMIYLLHETKHNTLRSNNEDTTKKELFKIELDKLFSIINSEFLDWVAKYDLCWKIKDTMLDYKSFDWHDPDKDKEDDVRAFYEAAKETLREWGTDCG